MRNTATAILLCAAAICAPAATKKKTQSASSAPQAVTIPKDAVPNPDGVSYSYTDKQGKRWTYTKTPFGIMKAPAADPPPAAVPPSTPDSLAGAKAIDKGDTVRFERKGPFGTMSWEKKKADLTDDERRLLDGQNAKTE